MVGIPKSFDSHDAITGESSDEASISSNTMSRGHNTEGQQSSAEIPQQEEIPAVHKPAHISVSNSVPGVSVVAVQKPASTASPTTPAKSSPTDEEQPTVDQIQATEGEPEPAQPSVEEGHETEVHFLHNWE